MSSDAAIPKNSSNPFTMAVFRIGFLKSIPSELLRILWPFSPRIPPAQSIPRCHFPMQAVR